MTELTTMSERKRVGHVGAVVADNIQRLREEKNLSRPDLARRINELHQEDQHAGKGWELSPSKINALAITRIENGERRVDVDDLVLFAAALNVTVPILLMPHIPAADEHASWIVGPTGDRTLSWYWNWLVGKVPIVVPDGDEDCPELRRALLRFMADTLPPWSDSFKKLSESENLDALIADYPNNKDDSDSDDQ